MTLFAAMAVFAAGLALLLKGADWLLEGSCAVARKAGVSELAVGLTLVAFGTSLPEFFINVVSRLQGQDDVTLGDVFGSNVANVLLILGLSAALRPLSFKRRTVVWEIPFALTLAGVAWLLVLGDGASETALYGLDRRDGLILLTLFALFVFYVFRSPQAPGAPEALPVDACPLKVSILKIAGGVPALALGAKAVVGGAVWTAATLHIHSSVIALTAVAVGTSLPELATSLWAVAKKRPEIAVGNVVGSNIFNLGWILGVSAAFKPLPVPRPYLLDMAAGCVAVALLLGMLFRGVRGHLVRSEGVFFVVCYGAYAVLLFARHR